MLWRILVRAQRQSPATLSRSERTGFGMQAFRDVTHRTPDLPHACFHRPELEQSRVAVVINHNRLESENGYHTHTVRRVLGGQNEVGVVDVVELEVRSQRTVRIVIPRG